MTDKEIAFPQAKINIGLLVTRKREDGYHILQTLFYPIDWRDILEIVPNGEVGQCRLFTTGIVIDGPTDNNLIVKAYKLLQERFPELPGVDIHLEKQIPFGAGMGGGSSDGAQTLVLLKKMFNLDISQQEIEALAAKLGADCAFFCRSGAQYCEGLGFELEPYELSLKGKWLLVIKPLFGVSTKEAYAHVKPQVPEVALYERLKEPISQWKGLIHNDFEDSVFPQYPELTEIKQALYDNGAIYASMSGSGSAMFGIFDNEPKDYAKWFAGKAYIIKCMEASL